MKSALTIWLLLAGLLMQSVAWALPAQQQERIERLAHEMAHGSDHGHHGHDAAGHQVDASLTLTSELSMTDEYGPHAPHHSHASDSIQVPGLPVATESALSDAPRHAPRGATPLQPPSVDPDDLLRPPQPRG